MANVSKDQLIYENSVSFPNNNYGAITPANLRNFNVDLIDSTVNQAQYTADSNSFDGRIDDLNSTYNQFSSSTNAYTQSNENRWAYLDSISGSWVTEPETGSFAVTNATNTFTANQIISGNLNLTGGITASLLHNYVLMGDSSGRTIAVPTASLQGPSVGGATTGSNNFIGNQSINGNLTVSGSTLLSGSTTITGSLNVSSTFLAPLGQGKIWVGGADGKNSYTEPTASFVGTGSYNTFSQSVDLRLDNLEAFSTSLDDTFVNQTELAQATGSLIDSIATKLNTSSFESYTGSNDSKVNSLINATGSYTLTSSFQSYTSSNDGKVNSLINATGSYATTGSNTFSGSQTFNDTITANSTASFNNSVRFNNSSRIVASNNPIQLDVASGSIVLSTPASIPSVSQLGFVSSSTVGTQVNLIFRNGTAATDLILSGSNNILGIPAGPTAGFKRYLTDHNLVLGGQSPQITGSAAFSPTLSGNVLANQTTAAITMRIPISSSAYTVNNNIVIGGQVNLGTAAATHYERAISGTTVQGNALFNGTINATAFTTNLVNAPSIAGNLLFGAGTTLNMISSSLTYASNIQNGGVTVNNSFSPTAGTVAAGLSARASLNTIYGQQHAVNFSGTNTSTTQTKEFFANLLAGTFISASVPTGDSCNIISTAVIGNALVVTGSSTNTASTAAKTYDGTYGSAFIGRFNALDGTKALTAETVFAVGTGNALSNRKTGFLIDSGSNTFVEGSLNVSGSTSLSGSLRVSGSSVLTGSIQGNVNTLTISSNTASIDFSLANFFDLTLVSGSTTRVEATNKRSGQTSNLRVTQPSVGTGSIVFSTDFKFPSISPYTASIGTGSVDIVTFITFDTGSIYTATVKNLV